MTPLRVLLIEDNQTDALLIVKNLTRHGFEVDYERVETAAAFVTALAEKSWDVILSDYSLPGFDGLRALQMLQSTERDIPFILVSGAMGEETAVMAMKSGAHDYLVKDRLTRLGPAVSRELAEAQKRAQLRETQAIVAQAHQLAELANQRKSQALAFVAHEFKNPLGAVTVYAEMLEQGVGGEVLSERQLRYARNILLGAQHLKDLVNDILDIAAIEAGKVSLQPEWINVQSLLDDIHMVADAYARKKSLELEFQLDETVEVIHADPKRMRQILINLVSNAIKFTPENGRIVLQVQRAITDDWVVFEVSDNGIGMTPEEVSALFTEFYGVNKKDGITKEGLGVGLALTKRLVELHEGTIEAKSELGLGSCFTVRLPVTSQTLEDTVLKTLSPTLNPVNY